jgi:hypothetical protein
MSILALHWRLDRLSLARRADTAPTSNEADYEKLNRQPERWKAGYHGEDEDDLWPNARLGTKLRIDGGPRDPADNSCDL